MANLPVSILARDLRAGDRLFGPASWQRLFDAPIRWAIVRSVTPGYCLVAIDLVVPTGAFTVWTENLREVLALRQPSCTTKTL